MENIKKLKKLEEAYQISKDYYDREKLTEIEYRNKIGKFIDMEPYEIMEEIIETIKYL